MTSNHDIANELRAIPIIMGEEDDDAGVRSTHYAGSIVTEFAGGLVIDINAPADRCTHCDSIARHTHLVHVVHTADGYNMTTCSNAQMGISLKVSGNSRVFGPMCAACSGRFTRIVAVMNQPGHGDVADEPVYNPVRRVEVVRAAAKPKRKGQRGVARGFCRTASVKREYRVLAANRRFARRR